MTRKDAVTEQAREREVSPTGAGHRAGRAGHLDPFFQPAWTARPTIRNGTASSSTSLASLTDISPSPGTDRLT